MEMKSEPVSYHMVIFSENLIILRNAFKAYLVVLEFKPDEELLGLVMALDECQVDPAKHTQPVVKPP